VKLPRLTVWRAFARCNLRLNKKGRVFYFFYFVTFASREVGRKRADFVERAHPQL
jgi:hypothetical protein